MVPSALSSLLFDCEVTLAADDVAQKGSADCAHDASLVVQRLEMLSRPSSPFARELRYCVQRISNEACGGDAPDVYALSRRLAALGYVVAVRTALPGSGAECFKSLRHEFLVVRGTGEYSGMEFLVEPALRQHFTIPHPSPDYDYVLSRAPDVYVGGSCRLVPIVQLLCALMADSFQRQGLALPPWRKEPAMLSKWLPSPARCRDLLVTSAAAAAELFSTAAAAAAPTAAPISYGYITQPAAGGGDMSPPGGLAYQPQSDSSNGSSAGGGSCAMGCSPVSVLPVQMQLSGSGSNAATTTVANCNNNNNIDTFCAVHGFEPLPRMGAAELRFTSATARCAEAAAPGFRLEDSASGICGGGVPVRPYAQYDSNSYGSGGGSSGGGRTGLLSVQLQQRFGGSNADGRISTRPPVHQGEMAIRVVRLVGFAPPDQPPQGRRPQHCSSSQQQQQARGAAMQGQHPSPALVPWKLLRGSRAA